MKHLFKLSLLWLTLLLPANANAEDIKVNGIYYQTNGDKATVTNQNYNTSTSWEASSYYGSVIIPATFYYNGMTYTVTEIGGYAFDGSGVTSVTIPNTVTSIEEGAFQGCFSMTGVTIPNSVTHIGQIAFSCCHELTSIDIPNSVTSIGGGAFTSCSNLTSINIPNSVTSIGGGAFSFCSGLTKVNITDLGAWCNIDFGNDESNPLYYAHHLYLNDSEATDLMIPNSVTTIGDYAFQGCSGLTSVTIPNSVTSIGSVAFNGCSNLEVITVESGNTAFDSRNNCNAIIETATNMLIVGCKATVIPNSVTSIGYGAFSGCIGLTSIVIPNSVTTIGRRAFYDCSGLTNIDIPNSVEYIEYGAFNSCSALTKVNITDLGAWCNIDFGNDESNPLYYAHHLYLNDSEVTDLMIPNSVTTIGDYAFYNCTGLTSIDIPNSVTSIGSSAFRVCTGLTSITIPNSVTTIGDYAFSNCTGLNDVYSFINDPSIVSMGSRVFYQSPSNYATRTLHVPVGTVSAYQADTKWRSYFGSILEMEPDTVLTTSIELNQASAELTEGESLQLTATVLPEEATDKSVTWTSSDEAVATVDCTGLVTAISPSTAIITATTTDGSNLSASCNVTVLKRIVLAESIKLNVTTAGLNEGATLQLIATVLPEDCDNKTVIWESNNPSVATVDKNGLVTTHSVGTATITAITTDGSNLSTTCTVTLLPVGLKGDVNGDSNVSIGDVSALIDYLLSGTWN